MNYESRIMNYGFFMKKIFIILILIPVAFLGVYFYYINTPANKDGGEVNFMIEKGEGVNQISNNLAKAGLIKSKFFFETYAWLEKVESKFKTGSYTLSQKQDIKEITKSLISGKSGEEQTMKILEGWTSKDVAEYLEKESIVKQDEFYDMVGHPHMDYRKSKLPKPKDFSSEFGFLKDKPAHYGLEGFLFPDTYRIFKGASTEDVVRKMLSNFDKKLTPEMREEIERQGKTIYDVIIMASIIEKEVRTEKDMKVVAGIFWDRLKIGQAFQSDAGLSYALDDNVAAHSGKDLELDSPYNMYKYKGLPPTPISNPGLAAIKAAIYPTYTDYNYFLNKPDTGETVFSVTYEEHLRNKYKYLK